MTSCLHERVLQAWLDGELSPEASADVQSHLACCAVCAANARAAEQTLSLVDDAWQADLPDRAPAARLLARIEERLASQTATTARRPPEIATARWLPEIATARWKIGAAIAVLAVAVIGAVVTRFPQPTPAPPQDAPPPTVAAAPAPDAAIPAPKDPIVRLAPASRSSRPRTTSLESETNRHLGQTQLLLRSIRNAGDEAVSDLAYERELSRELLNRNRLLRRRAQQKDHARAEELLSHIEPLLLDIANLPDQPAADEMRSLKELIRSQQIIAEMQLYAGRNLF